MGDPHAKTNERVEAGSDPRPDRKQPVQEGFAPASTILLRAEQAWTELGRGVHDRRHGFHMPTLCTLDGEGMPVGRIVVLRKAVREQALLLMHTDARSEKAQALRGLPEQTGPCTVVLYDISRRLQLRVRGLLTLHTQGPIVANQWAASSLSSRRCYLAPHAPGSVQPTMDHNLPEHLLGKTPTPDETRAGKDRFAVLACTMTSVDMLHLGAFGHSRCEWSYDGAGTMLDGRWLSP
jgi:pyridoxamine 5'-phosphate oxidase